MTTTDKPKWRWGVKRWIVLAIMILGGILGSIFVPIQPEITVAAERLMEHPLFTLPVIGDFYLVNTLPTLALTLVLLFLVAFFIRRSLLQSLNTDLAPRGIGNIAETALEALYNLTEGSAGAKWAPVIFPWFATIILYVLFGNLIKLLPGFESIGVLQPAEPGSGYAVSSIGGIWATLIPGKVATGGYILAPFFRGITVDLNFTVALALISVVMTQVIGFRAQGLGYLSKFFNFRTMFKAPFFGAMDFLVGLLELVSELSKIVSFAFRLFGNMFAGVVLVAIAAALIGKITILPAMLFMFELFIGAIQAFVFGMLTMVFMGQVTQGHGPAEEHAGAH
jgi:F-type H+-transporting ATPase subunit a